MDTQPMKKILAAVDGSSASIDAARFALQIAAPTKADVVLIYVSPPLIMPGDVPIAPLVDMTEAQLGRGAAVLKEVASALQRPDLVTKNMLGAPAEVIADIAAEEGFDLVVVGNKGRNAVSRMLLGSVADRVVHICKKPVLVVR
jgi:nucleotide-binding universal stress UspA family protein